LGRGNACLVDFLETSIVFVTRGVARRRRSSQVAGACGVVSVPGLLGKGLGWVERLAITGKFGCLNSPGEGGGGPRRGIPPAEPPGYHNWGRPSEFLVFACIWTGGRAIFESRL